jgi:hypothetical protein
MLEIRRISAALCDSRRDRFHRLVATTREHAIGEGKLQERSVERVPQVVAGAARSARGLSGIGLIRLGLTRGPGTVGP